MIQNIVDQLPAVIFSINLNVNMVSIGQHGIDLTPFPRFLVHHFGFSIPLIQPVPKDLIAHILQLFFRTGFRIYQKICGGKIQIATMDNCRCNLLFQLYQLFPVSPLMLISHTIESWSTAYSLP